MFLLGAVSQDWAQGTLRSIGKDDSDPYAYKAVSEAIIYNALSAGGIVIGIILIAYGLIPKRQSG
jgi:hypothetical protein